MTGLLALARPRQWIKNLLIFAAPIAAGALLIPNVLIWTVIALACFCLASSSIYYFNDVIDVEADRAHPTKFSRPVASGRVAPRTAIATGVMLMVVAVCVPISLGNWRLGVVIAGYLTLQLLYVLWLKQEPVFDIACIALGMVLRAIAGGVAADIPISNAFLIVVGFGSLFVATGKRFSEKINESGSPDQTRPVLAHYSANYLRAILAITAAVTVIGYVLWAFEIAHGSTVPFAQLSTIPFTLCIMRYFLGVDRGEVEAPEYALFADRGLLLLGLIWGALFVGQVLTA